MTPEPEEDEEIEFPLDLVSEKLKKTCNRKSPGLDGVNYKILKILNLLHLTLLTELFFGCLRYRVFPVEWKIGKVVWLLKEGRDPLSEDSYRPITLLSNLGKVFEKVIAELMYSHLDKEKCIAKEQYGFMRKLSTEDAIHKFTEHSITTLQICGYR